MERQLGDGQCSRIRSGSWTFQPITVAQKVQLPYVQYMERRCRASTRNILVTEWLCAHPPVCKLKITNRASKDSFNDVRHLKYKCHSPTHVLEKHQTGQGASEHGRATAVLSPEQHGHVFPRHLPIALMRDSVCIYSPSEQCHTAEWLI